MRKTPAYFIFLGLLIGAIFGFGVRALNGNSVHGMQLGAMAGLFIAWIMTAPTVQK
jgi:hypothetical protein